MRVLCLTLVGGFVSVESILVRTQLRATQDECKTALNEILSEVTSKVAADFAFANSGASAAADWTTVSAKFNAVDTFYSIFQESKICAKFNTGCAGFAGANWDQELTAGGKITGFNTHRVGTMAAAFDVGCTNRTVANIFAAGADKTCFDHVRANALTCENARSGDTFAISTAASAQCPSGQPSANVVVALNSFQDANSTATANWKRFYAPDTDSASCKAQYAIQDDCKKELSAEGKDGKNDADAITSKDKMQKDTCKKFCTVDEETDPKTKKVTKRTATCNGDNILSNDAKNNSKCKDKIASGVWDTAAKFYTKKDCVALLETADENNNTGGNGGTTTQDEEKSSS